MVLVRRLGKGTRQNPSPPPFAVGNTPRKFSPESCRAGMGRRFPTPTWSGPATGITDEARREPRSEGSIDRLEPPRTPVALFAPPTCPARRKLRALCSPVETSNSAVVDSPPPAASAPLPPPPTPTAPAATSAALVFPSGGCQPSLFRASTNQEGIALSSSSVSIEAFSIPPLPLVVTKLARGSFAKKGISSSASAFSPTPPKTAENGFSFRSFFLLRDEGSRFPLCARGPPRLLACWCGMEFLLFFGTLNELRLLCFTTLSSDSSATTVSFATPIVPVSLMLGAIEAVTYTESEFCRERARSLAPPPPRPAPGSSSRMLSKSASVFRRGNILFCS
mmetsp:Transcript_23251/g.58799  ORF Transcript_23251/g.58799 Transcript_23251/m.58799 type:complete len:336 (+) Transcript_23251:2442-3449(+)